MKKIIALALVFILAMSALTVNAALPEFFAKEYNNYSADYSFSLSFDSSDSIVSLLKEAEFPEEIENFVDIKALLETLLSQGMVMKLQADIESDFRKAELSLTSDAQYNVTINKNLNIGADMKMGMWMKMDLDAKTPVLEIIYSYPFLNKYFVIDAFELITDENEKSEMLAYLDSIFNREFLESVRSFSMELMEKYAEIKVSGTSCTVKFSNEAFIGMMSEIFPFIFDKISGFAGEEIGAEVFGYADIELPPADGLQILGEDGISYKYSLSAGKISSADMTADISVDISKIVEAMGGEWEYTSNGLLDFTTKMSLKLSKIGNTKVDFPSINESNSFTLSDMIPDYSAEANTYEPESYYPHYFVTVYSSTSPEINGEIYVPLRQVLEYAYEDTVSLEYKNGVITAKCEYFPGFKTLKLTENKTEVFLDAQKHSTSAVMVKDGITWVSSSLFEDLFGWQLYEAMHDLLNKEYYVSFSTYSF